jgi:hypothetical protein
MWRAIARFPIPMACTVAFVLDWLIGATDSIDLLLIQGRPDMRPAVLPLGFLASLAASLYAEGRRWSAPHGTALSSLALTAVVGIVVIGNDGSVNDWTRESFLFAGLALLVCTAPFRGRESSEDAFWLFGRNVCLSTVCGFVSANLFACASTLVLLGLEHLFTVETAGSVYGRASILGFVLVWPLLTLTLMPRPTEQTQPYADAPCLRAFTNAFLVPVAVVYVLAMHLYPLFVLAGRGALGGVTAAMMCLLSVVAVVAYLTAYRWRHKGPVWIKLYCRCFPAALAIPTLTLGVALVNHLSAEGVTESRYPMVVIWLWLALIIAYAVRGKRRPSLVTHTSAVLFLLAAYGPWGAVSLSTYSQMAILENLLAANGMIEDGQAVAPPNPLGEAQRAHRRRARLSAVDPQVQRRRPFVRVHRALVYRRQRPHRPDRARRAEMKAPHHKVLLASPSPPGLNWATGRQADHTLAAATGAGCVT